MEGKKTMNERKGRKEESHRKEAVWKEGKREAWKKGRGGGKT